MPPIYSGSTPVTKMYLGGTQLSAVYLGVQSLLDVAYTLPTPLLLESFDSLTGWSVPSGGTVITLDTGNKVQGTASVAYSISPDTGAGGNTTKTGYPAYSAAGFNTIALMSDLGFDPELHQGGIGMRLGMTGVNYPSTASVGTFPDFGGTEGDYILGKIWKFTHTDDLAASGLVDGTSLGVRLLTASIAPAASNVSRVDCLMANAKGRPTIVLTFDDGRNGPHEQLAYMQARNIKGTLYLPWENIGTNSSSFLTLERLAEMKALDWDMQLDGTGNDSAITTRHATVAAAVSHLAEGKAWLLANGLNADARHFCYPNGLHRLAGTRIQVASVTRTAASPVMTMTSTTGITVGMRAVGFGVPLTATVLTVDSATQVTLTQNVTSSNTRAMSFTDTSGAFHTGKLQAGLRSAGWLTGRTTMGGPIYSRYGIGDQGLILPGHTTTDAVIGGAQAHIDQVVKYGATKVMYIHDIFDGATWINMDTAVFRNWIDALAAARDAGQIDILTLSEWYARDCATPATPPAI